MTPVVNAPWKETHTLSNQTDVIKQNSNNRDKNEMGGDTIQYHI